MPEIRLIATDLDGTLLNSQGKLSQENRQALEWAISKGIIVTLSTGRMYASTLPIAREIGITTPLICYNGALIIEPGTGEIIRHTPLNLDLTLEILSFLKYRNAYVQSYIGDTLYVRCNDESYALNYEQCYGVRGISLGDSIYIPNVAPTKLLTISKNQHNALSLHEELYERFGSQVYITHSNSDFVEMMDIRANKANALQFLTTQWDIPMDQVISMGDGDNDKEMLKITGISIAVANASSSAQEASKKLGPSNDNHIAQWVVQHYILPSS